MKRLFANVKDRLILVHKPEVVFNFGNAIDQGSAKGKRRDGVVRDLIGKCYFGCYPVKAIMLFMEVIISKFIDCKGRQQKNKGKANRQPNVLTEKIN